MPKGDNTKAELKLILEDSKDSYTEGEIVGICEVYLNKNKVGEVSLYCDRDIEKDNFFDNFKYNMRYLFDKE